MPYFTSEKEMLLAQELREKERLDRERFERERKAVEYSLRLAERERQKARQARSHKKVNGLAFYVKRLLSGVVRYFFK